MRVWTLNELFSLTRAELFALHYRITAELDQLPEGSDDHTIALTNLRNIRRVLARPNLSPS